MRLRTFATVACALAIGVLTVWAAPAPAHQTGDRVQVTGIVTAPGGEPIADLKVVLVRSRETFDIRRFRRTQKKVNRISAVTSSRGEYTIEWPWDKYYNRYDLVVGIPVQTPNGETLRVLEEVDLTRRLQKGSPVVSSIVVEKADYVTSLRAFLAQIDTENEREVYERSGKPDKVETVQYPDRDESAWWYFALGKVYRFDNGVLKTVEEFDPVKDF